MASINSRNKIAGPCLKRHKGCQTIRRVVGKLAAHNDTAALKAAPAGIAAKHNRGQVGLPFAVWSPPIIDGGLKPDIYAVIALAGHQEWPIRIAQPLQRRAKPVEVRARFGMYNALP